jgi:hypothetical protein
MRSIIFFVLCTIFPAGAQQQNSFLFKRPIDGVTTDGWYRIGIGPQVQERLNSDLSDMRIFNIQEHDTTELPYIVRILEDHISEKQLNVAVINKSTKNNNCYVTFEMPAGEKINQIEFHFEEPDFDGDVKLEGSGDQKDWFLISEGNRIVSLHEPVNFRSTLVRFPTSNFRFIRAEVKANTKLHFVSATITKRDVAEGTKVGIPVSVQSSFDKKGKQTKVVVTFPNAQQLSGLTLGVENKEDYYRTLRIEVLNDSARSSAGWQYYYHEIFNGYVTSLDSNSFHWHPVKAKKIRLTIFNADNEPLKISNVRTEGPQVSLEAWMRTGKNFLFYSSIRATAPQYDVKNFAGRIPASLPEAVLGVEIPMTQLASQVSPLFEKKIWLWVVMGIIIAVLGFFTTRMLRSNTA